MNTFNIGHSSHQVVRFPDPEELLYTNVEVPLKRAKLEDIEKTMDYIPREYKDYYLDIISKSIVARVTEDDND